MQRERDAERDGGERVAEVVDQVGKQRDAAAHDEHGRLCERGESQDAEGERHRAYALTRALDALVNQAVGVAMLEAGPARVASGTVRRRPA